MKHIIVISIICIIVIFTYYLFFRFTLHILSKKDAEHILQRNDDSFYETLTEMDLKMRGVSSIEEYRHRIIDCCVEPTIGDRFRIGWIIMCACYTLCYTHPIRNNWFDSIFRGILESLIIQIATKRGYHIHVGILFLLHGKHYMNRI